MKKNHFIITLFLSLFVVEAAVVHAESEKKGVGVDVKHSYSADQLQALNVSWYYNWSPKANIPTQAQFVPMFWNARRLNEHIDGDYVLGYNEPDHKDQANITVEDALASWPNLASKAGYVGSPGVAGNPVKGDWLPRFMAADPKVDFITVHWYKGIDPKRFIRDMEEVHDRYGKPLWVTEFSPQTISSSRREPDKYTQEQVDGFISEVIQWMESTSWVERYAWHDSRTGTSALFDENGELTETGKAYANSE